jgi:3-oxoadipate enol-lactonase
MSEGITQFSIEGKSGRLTGWTYGEDAPGPEPALFIHPINLAGECWKDVVTRLEPQRYSLMPDMRGHGSSDAIGPFGLDHWVEDCFTVLDAFGVQRAHLVGGSLGGPIGVAMAAAEPDRALSITAFGSALTIEGGDVEEVLDVLREKGVKGMFRDVIPEISVGPDTDPDTIERILEIANPNDVDTVFEIWKQTIAADVSGLAAGVRCPVLVVNGEFDKTCTPEQGAAMAGALSTEPVRMPGLGHLPMMESPAQTAELVNRFLSEVEAGVAVRARG